MPRKNANPEAGPSSDIDISRRFTVRKTVVIEYTWVLPEGIGREDAKAYAEDLGEPHAHEVSNVGESWTVEQESKSDVVRRLFVLGHSAAEIAKLTGWDYSFVYGVSWRDKPGPRGNRHVRVVHNASNGTGGS